MNLVQNQQLDEITYCIRFNLVIDIFNFINFNLIIHVYYCLLTIKFQYV